MKNHRVALILSLFAAVLVAVALLTVTTEDAAHADHGGAHCKVITHRGLDSNGDENQPLGITQADVWGWAEIDASVTKDGEVAALHDAHLGRLTGGHSTDNVWEVTYDELWAMPHPYGPFRKTTTLLTRAASLDTPVMVTINNWTQVKAQGYANQTLDTLYAAAQAHPRPHVVFFGGFGSQDAMRNRHPDASTFWRFENGDTRAHVLDNTQAEGLDLVALPPEHYVASTVDGLRDRGAWVATRQVLNRDRARDAQAAGIATIQGNDAELIATGWCR